MKTLNHFVVTAVAVALLGIVDATATELQSSRVHYGQGGSVTFFKPPAKIAIEGKRVAKHYQAEVKWIQQSIPNGFALSYAVPKHPGFDIAPLK
jgi:hypothetical protein